MSSDLSDNESIAESNTEDRKSGETEERTADIELALTILSLCFERPLAIEYFSGNLPVQAMWFAGKGIAEVYEAMLDLHTATGGDVVDVTVFRSWIENETRIFDALGGHAGLDSFLSGLPGDTGERQDALASYAKYRFSKIEQGKLAGDLLAVTQSKDRDSKEQLAEILDQIKELNVATSDPAKYIETGSDIADRAEEMWELPDFISTQFKTLNKAMGYDEDNSGFCKGAVHAVLASSGKGKPLHINTNVTMGDGSIKHLKDVVVGDKVINSKGQVDNVTEVHEQGMLPVICITTRSGRKIVSALDHGFLTVGGWTEAKDLKLGTKLAMPSRVNAQVNPENNVAEFKKAAKTSYLGVPRWVSKGLESQITTYLSQALALNGRILAVAKSTIPIIDFTVSNSVAAGDIRILLDRFGVSSMLVDNNRKMFLRVADTTSARNLLQRLTLSGLQKGVADMWLSANPGENPKYVYDEITHIADQGTAECRCLTVERDHTFIAEGVVVHNSTFAKSLMNHWVDEGHTVLFVNYEEATAHWERVLFTQVTKQNVYKSSKMDPRERASYTKLFKDKMTEWDGKFLVKHNPDTPYYEDLDDWIRSLHRNGTHLDVIIVDTIQSLFLKKGKNLPRWGQYEEMMVRLEKLAKDTHSAIILTAQENSNRMKEKREVVQQSDAGGSLTIIQKCAVSIFITDANKNGAIDSIDDGVMQLQIPKNRITGKAFTVNPPHVRYNDEHKLYEEFALPSEEIYDKTSLNANDFDFN